MAMIAQANGWDGLDDYEPPSVSGMVTAAADSVGRSEERRRWEDKQLHLRRVAESGEE